MKPAICFVDENGAEYELKKQEVDLFELTAFNLNEIRSQESKCEIACYDEEYLPEIKKTLPNVVSSRIVLRELKIREQVSYADA